MPGSVANRLSPKAQAARIVADARQLSSVKHVSKQIAILAATGGIASLRALPMHSRTWHEEK
jgi:hypothetical protein